MPVDYSLQEFLTQKQESSAKADELRRRSGGPGGGDGGVDRRIDRLESGMDEVKKGLGDIKVTLAGIDERTRDFPFVAKTVVSLDERTRDFPFVAKTVVSLDERTKHMPTRWEAFLIIAAVVSVLGGAIGIAVRLIPG